MPTLLLEVQMQAKAEPAVKAVDKQDGHLYRLN